MTVCQHKSCKSVSQEKLQCVICSASFHYDCIGISKTNYNSIRKLAAVGVRWLCAMCLKKPISEKSSLEVIKASFQEEFLSITKAFDSKLDDLKSSFLGKFESQQQLNTEVLTKNLDIQSKTGEVMNQLNENMASLKVNVEQNKIDKSEDKIKESKKFNIMLFKLPESNITDPLEAYNGDFNKVMEAIDPKKTLRNGDIVELYRLGKKVDDKIRPIVIKVKTLDLKEEILKLRNPSCIIDNKSTRVYLAPDRTKKEVAERKILVEELNRRKDEGETNLIIRGDKIVERRPFRFTPNDFYKSQGAGGAVSNEQTPVQEEPDLC